MAERSVSLTHKTCPKCKQVKLLTSYKFRSANPGKPSSWCRACENVQALERYRRNKKSINARIAMLYAQSPEKQQRQKQIAKQWRLRNIDRAKKQKKAWKIANHDKVINYWHKRRAHFLAAPLNDLTDQDWQDIKVAFKFRCAYCSRKMKRLTQDHITPLFKGGSHTKANVVPACQSCNSKKHTGPPLKPVQPLLL